MATVDEAGIPRLQSWEVQEAINQLMAIADELEAERTRMEAAALAAGERLAARLEESRPKCEGTVRKPCLKSTGR